MLECTNQASYGESAMRESRENTEAESIDSGRECADAGKGLQLFSTSTTSSGSTSTSSSGLVVVVVPVLVLVER